MRGVTLLIVRDLSKLTEVKDFHSISFNTSSEIQKEVEVTVIVGKERSVLLVEMLYFTLVGYVSDLSDGVFSQTIKLN
ncbi:hypothetical protein DGG96_03660 [Legionella qingyii]|uniref:Uncharacterized protein n=1 Tax=Legionella qingyii TaxID=2184757 RepID=A0A317U6Z5_9GAMM|nr:hypothetical protein DGG96_03660 [Legionella qingyii]